MPGIFAPAVGQRFAGRFVLRTFIRGSRPARVFLASDGSATPVSLVLLDPAACHPAAWKELARVVSAATERAFPGLVPLRGVSPAAPDPPFCFADSPIGWSFDRLRVDGPPAWQKQDTPLWERALRLGERVAALLNNVHSTLGVPHLALTPQRLILTEATQLAILDFGVGEIEPAFGRNDDQGYRAPEQVESRGDAVSDVYSLAAIVFELISGERPSPRIPPRLRSLVPRVPQAVDDLFAEALAPDPTRRFADMDELQTAMRDALGLEPTRSHSSAPTARSELVVAPPHGQPEIASQRSDLPILPWLLGAPAPTSVQPAPLPSIISAPMGGVAFPSRPVPAHSSVSPVVPVSSVVVAAATSSEPLPVSPRSTERESVSVAPNWRPTPDPTGRRQPGAHLEAPRSRDTAQTELNTPASLERARTREPPTEKLPLLARTHSQEAAEHDQNLRIPSAERTHKFANPALVRSPVVDRTEVLSRDPGVGGVTTPEPPTERLLPVSRVGAELGANAVAGDDVTRPFTRTPARPAEAERTVLELRHLSRVVHTEATLELSAPDVARSFATQSDSHPESTPAALTAPGNWTSQRLLVVVNAVLLAVLIGLLALLC